MYIFVGYLYILFCFNLNVRRNTLTNASFYLLLKPSKISKCLRGGSMKIRKVDYKEKLPQRSILFILDLSVVIKISETSQQQGTREEFKKSCSNKEIAKNRKTGKHPPASSELEFFLNELLIYLIYTTSYCLRARICVCVCVCVYFLPP